MFNLFMLSLSPVLVVPLIIIVVFTLGLIFVISPGYGELFKIGHIYEDVMFAIGKALPYMLALCLACAIASMVLLLIDKNNRHRGRIAFAIVVISLAVLILILVIIGGISAA